MAQILLSRIQESLPNIATHEFGQWSEEELQQSATALGGLKVFRDRLRKDLSKPADFFEPNHKLDSDSRKEPIRKLKFFNQTAMTHSLFLRHEFVLKLLSVIDGYIVAADQKAPLLVYLAVDAKKDPANDRRVKFNSKERRGLSRRHRITPRLGISPMRRAGAKLSSRRCVRWRRK